MTSWSPLGEPAPRHRPDPARYIVAARSAVVPPAVAAWLAERVDLDRLRVEARDGEPEAYAVLTALRVAALAVEEVVPTSVPSGSDGAPSTEAPSMSAADVAVRAGCTARAVTKAARNGRLVGEQDASGAWRFAVGDVEVWIEERGG